MSDVVFQKIHDPYMKTVGNMIRVSNDLEDNNIDVPIVVSMNILVECMVLVDQQSYFEWENV